MNARCYTKAIISIFLISLFLLVPQGYAVTDTRYMRSDTHTVNGLLAYKLNITQTATVLFVESTVAGVQTGYWGIRIWKRASNGTETEITPGNAVAIVSRGSDGSGLQSANYAVAETSLESTDAIVVRVYHGTSSPPSSLTRAFITEQLGASKLDAVTWTVYYYTYRSLSYTTDDKYTNGFDNAKTGWTRVGSSPYLHNTDGDYVQTKSVSGETIGDWSFANSAMGGGDTLYKAYLRLECTRAASGFELIEVYVYDGSSWSYAGTISPFRSIWSWFQIDVTSKLNTLAKINACKVYLKSSTATYNLLCRRLVRRILYNPQTTIRFYHGKNTHNSRITNFQWTPIPTAEWHDIVTWTFNLTTRQWLTVSTWNFNLSTMQWTDVASWSFNLTTMAWTNITTWSFTLISRGWQTIATWALQLTTTHIAIFLIGLLVFFALVFLAVLLALQYFEED